MSDKKNSTELLEAVLKELQLVLVDSQKADSGNAAASVRARKRIHDAIGKLKEIRVVILDNNKSETKKSKGE